MRNQVIDFLRSTKNTPQQKYNLALQFYMQANTPNPGIIRFHNTAGYSPQRLKELLYDLEQAFEIKPSDLAAKKIDAPISETLKSAVFEIPKWTKGAAGNKERKAFCAEHGIFVFGGKNKDLDKAIAEFVKEKTEQAEEESDEESDLQRKATEKEKAYDACLKVLASGQALEPAIVADIFTNTDTTKEEQENIVKAAKNHIFGETNDNDGDDLGVAENETPEAEKK
ncbi:hypothetical protein JJL45_05215 [Tamlana sp. s12]|uniref:hypothetical protein n=1 Tax=Tamlana sp. s12 TaxID=1630406 RepID=UPI0007FC59CB|nr:hypothetical protein [Tamlana sp. s12]OBQ56096.1 hypothetical protein VQ01_06845 [Tamlana sp. s12]QQY83391.1 hypothetical protein JJL45_05215 [Tamlana sp. s12]